MQTMQPTPDDAQSLRRCVRELASLSALSAAWSRSDPREIADGLANVLGSTLPATFVYVRVSDRAGKAAVETARTHRDPAPAQKAHEIGKRLEPLLEPGTRDPFPVIANPFGSGTLRLAIIPIGCEGDCGVVVAGSQRPDFPSQTDRLLLSVAANQAAVVLQRHQAEETLRRSERELADFFDNATIGLHWAGPDGTILRANRAELNLLGYSPDEYIGHHIAEFHADKDMICDMLRRLQAGEELYEYEARMRCKDGSIRHVLINSNVLWEDGRFIHTRCFTRDITDRKQAEEALRESEERYRRLVALLPVAVYTCEASGAITFYNDHAALLWGRAPRLGDSDSRFCGSFKLWRPDGSFLPHDETPMAVALHEGREFRNQEVVIERPDGTRITVLVNIDPVRDAEGRLVGAVNVFHDTTALKQSEETLRESERRFREMIDALPAAIYTTDAEGHLTHFNPACIELSGRVPELGTDKWCVTWELYHPDGRPMPHDECPMAVAVKEGRAVRGAEAIAERPDGTRIWFAPYPTPLRDSTGRVIGGINMLVDITERKRAEAEREALNRQLAAELADAERLHDISATSIREDDISVLYNQLLDAAMGIMKSDMASMQVVDERENALRMLAFRGFEPEFGKTSALDRGETWTSCSVARGVGHRVIVPDLEACDFLVGTPALDDHLKTGIRAVQSTPLISRHGRMVGMISTHWRSPHQPAERDLGRLDVLARQAADLLEHKQSEEALRRQTERLRLLWEAAAVLLTANNPDVMLRELFAKIGPHLGLDTYFNYMVDESGEALRLESCIGVPDPTARSITRLEFGQAICGTVALRQPIHATYIQQSDDPKAQLIKSFGIRAYACNPLMSGGQLLGTLSFASRTRDQLDDDELAFLETICHYVTMAYERLRLLDKLREADRRKDEFLATLAHELRNPLAPVRNAVQVLRLSGADKPELRWGQDVIERQVSHLTRLIDDLLDISRITRNKLELRRDRVELTEVIRGAVETSRPLIEQCGHELTITLPPEPIHLYADLVRLAQVFMNLLTNAAKYTDRGGRISLTAERQGHEIVVRVKDTGLGIPAEKLPHLFEMFFQVGRSLERSQGGLGIGLSLVRRLVELHGGSVKAHSAGVGKGSEFTVRLPVLTEASKPELPREPSENGAVKVGSSCRILVVDDVRDSADSLAMFLRLDGHDVKIAYDGLAAVEAAEQFRPEVVLLDIGMPKLNGYDACRLIREQPWSKNTFLVALTGWGQEEDKRRTEEAGFGAHLVKPVDPTALMKLLASLPAGESQLTSAEPDQGRPSYCAAR
jgi:PAS domain S-box-containing protein